MTGRSFFKKYGYILNLISNFLSVFPYKVRYSLYNFFAGCPGSIGILTRYLFFKTLCRSCGTNVYIGRWCTFKNIDQLDIGSNVSIHEYSYVDAIGSLSIGDDVSIAHNCSILTFEHSFDEASSAIKYQPLTYKQVVIESNVWIGCGCRILSGVIIKSKTVLGTNSVANKYIEGNGVFVGTPAIKVKNL
jgi:acetyltransferase-like isoleucine patch superfamily enzyme